MARLGAPGLGGLRSLAILSILRAAFALLPVARSLEIVEHKLSF
jgi:hypothetical protein